MNHKNNSMLLPTLVKNKFLVEQRREQIIKASVDLFIKNGFHKTTTREIAKNSGLSTGSLYEYITSKEDVLYLVCNSIHKEIEKKIGEAVNQLQKRKDGLGEMIRKYFQVCHQMQDHILLIYQEIGSLPKRRRKIVLDNEAMVTAIFKNVILEHIESQNLFPIEPKKIDLVAHNIAVLGHMWSFRRWFMGSNYSINEYIDLQTKHIIAMCINSNNS